MWPNVFGNEQSFNEYWTVYQPDLDEPNSAALKLKTKVDLSRGEQNMLDAEGDVFQGACNETVSLSFKS